MKEEQFKIDGNYNIIVNGVTNSPLSIGVEKPNAPVIGIIVLASVSSFVKSMNEEEEKVDLSPLLARHGANAKDWKPFGLDKTIEEVLYKFHEETGFRLKVHFLNELDLSPEARRSLKASGRKRIVFIIDPLALMNKKNDMLGSVINEADVGGGIIPLHKGMEEELKRYLTAIYEEKLDIWVYDKFSILKKVCFNFHLNVAEEKLFYRSISNLAFAHLKLKFKTNVNEIPWAAQYASDGLNEQSSEISIE